MSDTTNSVPDDEHETTADELAGMPAELRCPVYDRWSGETWRPPERDENGEIVRCYNCGGGPRCWCGGGEDPYLLDSRPPEAWDERTMWRRGWSAVLGESGQ